MCMHVASGLHGTSSITVETYKKAKRAGAGSTPGLGRGERDSEHRLNLSSFELPIFLHLELSSYFLDSAFPYTNFRISWKSIRRPCAQ